MAFARDVYTATNLQVDFTITFNYQAAVDVQVRVNGTLKTVGSGNDYILSTSTNVKFNAGLTTGDTVVLLRSTSQSARTVDYTAGLLSEADLDNDGIQMFYMAQEAMDKASTALSLDSGDEWDGETKLLHKIVDPVVDQDAATKKFVDTSIATAVLGDLTTPIPISLGGTAGATQSAARTGLGLVIGTDVLPEAAVPSQAEAEAGTSTTERSWTAQRVKQAVLSVGSATGDVKMHMGTSVESGWLELKGSTLATTTADFTGSAYEALYLHLWTQLTDTHFAIAGGRGGSAAADWAADKAGTMPDARGRALIGQGTGAGLTARVIGNDTIGGEDAIVPSHVHAVGSIAGASDGAHTHTVTAFTSSGGSGKGWAALDADASGVTTDSNGAHTHTMSGSVASTGVSVTDKRTSASIVIMTLIKL